MDHQIQMVLLMKMDLNIYVAWNWLADNGSASSNTDGSITSQFQLIQQAGFSIVSYTGRWNCRSNCWTWVRSSANYVLLCENLEMLSADWRVGQVLTSVTQWFNKMEMHII